MIDLYDDQKECLSRLRQAMTRKKSVLFQACTGFGKTAVSTYMMAQAASKGKRCIFTVPRRELLKQTSNTLDSYGINHSYIAGDLSHNPYAKTYIGMVDTMARRVERGLPDADMIIVDETHYGAGSLDAVIKYYKQRGAWVIGLSATPWKLSGKGLGCWYDDMVCGPSLSWLIDNKRLSGYRYFAGRTKPDLSKVKLSGGDYAKGSLPIIWSIKALLLGIASISTEKLAIGRLHVVRCASIKHSQMVCAQFNASGIPAAHVDGTTPDDEMRRIIQAYARRELLVLTFCDLFTFGFDLSQASGMDVCIESCSDLRPSKSLAAQMQYWGRALRKKPHPAIILDHVNNYLDHGRPKDERVWTLEDRNQGKKGHKEPTPPTRQCDNCFFHT